MPPPPPPPVNVPPPKVTVSNLPPPEVDSAGRGDLLSAIRKGQKLKKVPESEKKEKTGDVVGKVVDPNAPKKPSTSSASSSANAQPKPSLYVLFIYYLCVSL